MGKIKKLFSFYDVDYSDDDTGDIGDIGDTGVTTNYVQNVDVYHHRDDDISSNDEYERSHTENAIFFSLLMILETWFGGDL